LREITQLGQEKLFLTAGKFLHGGFDFFYYVKRISKWKIGGNRPAAAAEHFFEIRVCRGRV